jgi:tetratricopeptide (TPR) repeat protein
LFDHAQNVFWVGEIARQRGNLNGAEAASREYQRLAARMAALDPASRKWRMEGLYAATNLGIVLTERGQYAEASAEFQRALDSIEKLAAAEPRNSEYQKTHVELLAWLADARFGEGKLDEAIARRESQIALVERLMRTGGIDVEYRPKAIPARRALGRLLAARGDLRGALDQLQLAVRTGQLLIPAEPDNMIWVELTGGAELDLATIQLAARQVREAAESTRAGCELVGRLVGRDRSVGIWQRLEIDCLELRSRVALESGAREEALGFAQAALARARASRGGNEADRQGAIAGAYRLVGDVQRRLGDMPAAHRAWNSALDALPQSPGEHPRQTAVRAELLGNLDRAAEARPLRDRLKAIGYRDII